MQINHTAHKRTKIKPKKYRVFTKESFDEIPQLQFLTQRQRRAIQAVSTVLPFRVNNYVVEELIDWNNIPDDPLFQLSFPQEGMLNRDDFTRIYRLLHLGADRDTVDQAVNKIHTHLNPHPSGQVQLNIPKLDGTPLTGLQHKYRETVLFFPSQGQTCHAYCTYCFRWAQFVGKDNFKFASNEGKTLVRYLQKHPEVRDVILTGGDPMIMKENILRRYIEPLLEIDTLHTIRIGTKSVAWWPYRFVTDSDADDVLRLFEKVVDSGKHLALMSHYSHPRELSTPIAQHAIRRILSTGAVIRSQAPLIRRVNDDPQVWASMCQKQVDLGIVPYYMFVERDTGAKDYFKVPLHKALDIYTKAYQQLSGLGRTVRGPVMSCTPGKVLVEGVMKLNGEKVFILKLIQSRDPHLANQLFFAKYDETSCWFDDLKPIKGQKSFTDGLIKKVLPLPRKQANSIRP